MKVRRKSFFVMYPIKALDKLNDWLQGNNIQIHSISETKHGSGAGVEISVYYRIVGEDE